MAVKAKKVTVVKVSKRPKRKRRTHKPRVRTLADLLTPPLPRDPPRRALNAIPNDMAPTLVCPMAMQNLQRETDGTLKQSMYCIGALCMAWRVAPEPQPDSGFCGMAGPLT